MHGNAISLIATGVLILALVGAVIMSARGSITARYFLWSWAVLMFIVVPVAFFARTPVVSRMGAVLLVAVFGVALFLIYRYSVERLALSHEETRRVLAASNKGIEEERRLLSRRIHDDINPNLLLCRNTLQRVQSQLTDRHSLAMQVAQAAQLLDMAYKDLRDLIRNLRVEVIDTIGFTAALEALVNHYSSCFEKPVLVLEHNLPRRPDIEQDQALNAFKIIREALFNAIKHANAHTVVLNVQFEEDTYYASVIDDGAGMGRNRHDDGIGLIDMRERARLLATVLEIGEVNPGSDHPGTRIGFRFQAASTSGDEMPG